MNNYYEACIHSIEKAIEEQDYTMAKQLLDEELRMPYIPEIYHQRLMELQSNIPSSDSLRSPVYHDLEEIERALLGNPQEQIKALTSLEFMNIRMVKEEVFRLLQEEWLMDDIKKQLLIILVNQGILENIPVHLKDGRKDIDLSTIEHPLNSQAYQKCLEEIRDKLESDNPSLLILSQQLLEMTLLQDFPYVKEEYNAQDIIDKVVEYMEEPFSTQM